MAATLHGTELCGEFKGIFTYFIKTRETRVYFFQKTLELPKIPVYTRILNT